jgi:alcohol dehydrogenase class IV
MGYSKNDIEVISGDALDSQFNMTAPIRPTREEYRKIIVEALG